MPINRKVAILATVIGALLLLLAFFQGFFVIGIIFFPIIWGALYKLIVRIGLFP